jgi:hypothetical protein
MENNEIIARPPVYYWRLNNGSYTRFYPGTMNDETFEHIPDTRPLFQLREQTWVEGMYEWHQAKFYCKVEGSSIFSYDAIQDVNSIDT